MSAQRSKPMHPFIRPSLHSDMSGMQLRHASTRHIRMDSQEWLSY
jgi:hypothetical protein